MVDDLLSSRIVYATRTALESYTKEFEKKAQEERKLYIDVVEKSVKDIIKDEVKSLLPQILPKEVSDFTTPSTYEAAASLIEFELKKILLDKIEKSKSYQATPEYRELYDGLVKSYNFEKDLFSSYGNISKDAEPPKGSKSKDSKTSSSKGTKSQPKSSRKSVQAKEPVFEVVDTEMPQDQGGDTKDQPNVKVTPMDDWLKKLKRPSTPDPDWNVTKFVDSRPPQKWISRIAQADKPPLTFNELMNTPIDFSCYKAITDQLDWNNPEGYEYPFDLSKPLPFIKAQGRQVVLADYFFNNDLEYLKGRSSSRKYTTSTTKTKAAKYGFQESKHDVFSKKRIITVTHVKVIKWYGYRYLEEIIVRREDQMLYKFKEGDISRLNMHDIEDLLLLLLVEDLQLGFESYQKKLNITKLETFRSDISKMTPYTAYKNPQGIIYQDKLKRNMLMSSDELYKFCDGTLISIRWVLYDIDSKLSMIYLPKRR
ncbi:hypothetical protein Tco_1085922 [Tanacetum coccineum]